MVERKVARDFCVTNIFFQIDDSDIAQNYDN